MHRPVSCNENGCFFDGMVCNTATGINDLSAEVVDDFDVDECVSYLSRSAVY